MLQSIRYAFKQKFVMHAEDAYVWCTDYQPDDHALLGHCEVQRTITWLTKDSVLLKDTSKQ